MSELALEEKELTEQGTEDTSKANEGENLEEKSENQDIESKSENADTEDFHEAFLKELGLADEAEDTDGEAKSEATNTPKALSEEEVEQRVQQRLAAQRELENQQRQRDGVRQSFESRTGRIRTYFTGKIDRKEPITYQDVEALVNEFTLHHGQSLTVAKEDAAKDLTGNWIKILLDSADKQIPGIAKEQFENLPDFTAKLTAKAREGYVKESEVKKEVKAKLQAYKDYLSSKGITPGSKEVKGSSSSNTGVRGKKPDDILNDPNATHEDREKAFNEKWGI